MADIVFDIVKPMGELKQIIKRERILCDIVDEIKTFSHRVSPTHIDTVIYIACLIQSLVCKKDCIDKERLMRDILKMVFPSVTDEELDRAKEIVEDGLRTKRIKSSKLVKYALRFAREIFGLVLKSSK